MNPYRNDFNLKPSFKKRSILKTISWKFRIKINWCIKTAPIFFVIAFFMLALYAMICIIKQAIQQDNVNSIKQENERVLALKEKEDKIQREKDMIKAIEENNRLLKEMKNK